MDPRQFIKNSNIQVERPGTAPSIGQGVSSPIFNELRVGKFRPGIYNGVVNKLFTTDDKRLDIKYILKQRPKGHAPISNGITVDVNEIKGIYGRFQTGAIHTKDFGLKGDLNKNFSSAQFTGYIMDGVEKKNFSFNIYTNGKIRLSGGFLGSKNLKKQPTALQKYIVDTYTEKQKFLYNDIFYNNIGGQFLTNTNFLLSKMTQEFRQMRSWGVSFLEYEPEISPFLYLKYKEHAFILTTKSGKVGSGIVQLQGESNPDDLERAYSVGVELVKKLHNNGYTSGLINKNVNADKKTVQKIKTKASTCPKPRQPPCKDGFGVKKNPQGYDCCYKKPKKIPVKKVRKQKEKNTKITYDKDGTMRIGGKKCEKLTKPVLLEVAKKLGVGVRNKNSKTSICKALDKIEKGNSTYKIKGNLCREMKKEQLIALAISKSISVNDTDTVKSLCEKLENKPKTPDSPNALANELEKVLINAKKKENRKPTNIKRKLNVNGIKNDLVKLYGKAWMTKYGNVMNINKDVRDVKNKLTQLEKNKKFVTRDGVLKKMIANDTKRAMIKNWKLNKQQNLKKLLIEKEANKIYGKFGKNVVNKVVNFTMSLQKTPPLNGSRVRKYIQTLRELQNQPPLPLNKQRVVPPKPIVKRKKVNNASNKKMQLEIIKLNALIEKKALKNKVVRKLNSNSNSNSNSKSNFLSPRKKPVTKRKSNSNSNSYSSRKTIRKTNYNRNNTNSNSNSNSRTPSNNRNNTNSKSKSKTNNQQLNELYANFEKFTLKNKRK